MAFSAFLYVCPIEASAIEGSADDLARELGHPLHKPLADRHTVDARQFVEAGVPANAVLMDRRDVRAARQAVRHNHHHCAQFR